MIYPLGGLVIGALLGALGARRRGGKTADLLQWAAVGGILLGIAGLVVLLVLDRMMRAG
jgi:hypothetical protein